jgi:integrase
MLLLRICIGPAEVVGLMIGNLGMAQDYSITIIQHGKGNKRGFAKVAVEVRQAIDAYLKMNVRAYAGPEVLFLVSFHKREHLQERPLYLNQVERVVKQHTQAIGVALSPHGMRASFITQALEGGDLALVQDGVRHKYLRTTSGIRNAERTSIKNAVDFVWIE